MVSQNIADSASGRIKDRGTRLIPDRFVLNAKEEVRNQIPGTCIWIPCTFQKSAIMVTSKKSRDVLRLELAVVL